MRQTLRKRQIEARLAATPRPPSQSCSPAGVIAGQAWIRSRIQARHPASFGARRVPIRLGPADPVSEYRRAHLITLDGAARNSFATPRRLSPASTFSTARIRKSSEQGLGIHPVLRPETTDINHIGTAEGILEAYDST